MKLLYLHVLSQIKEAEIRLKRTTSRDEHSPDFSPISELKYISRIEFSEMDNFYINIIEKSL
jgi:hypothetical protein